MPTSRHKFSPRVFIGLIPILVLLTALYLPTLLQVPAAGENAYMDDVAEMQGGLSLWGTVHYTGYPLFTILGNSATTLLRGIGVAPVLAPTLYCLGWGYIALSLFYGLLWRLSGRFDVAMAGALLLGLVRSIWIHNVIAEVYSMTLALQILLLTAALWTPVTPATLRRRVWLLALIGGIGVAHHRMIAFMTPGLLISLLPGLRIRTGQEIGKLVVTFVAAVPLALIGFLPYVYLPARAWAGSPWVYGDPSTWAGFWAQFTGSEANWLVQLPANFGVLLQDIGKTFVVIITELTLPLAILCLIAILSGFMARKHRAAIGIAVLCALGNLLFLFFFFRAVMAEAVAMFIAAICVFALALAFARLSQARPVRQRLGLGVALAIGGALCLLIGNFGFVANLTSDQTGVDAIATARQVPRDNGQAVWMLAWGPRYTSVAFSKYVTGENADLTLAKHTADFKALVDSGKHLYTSNNTFYRFPLSWWRDQLGRPLALDAVGEGIIAIRPLPSSFTAVPGLKPLAHGIALAKAALCRAETRFQVRVTWYVAQKPDADLSVFVHLVGPNSDVPLAQDDRSAPVYGWYPTSQWQAQEQIEDFYSLPAFANAEAVSFGFYEQPTPGQFVNYTAARLGVRDAQPCTLR